MRASSWDLGTAPTTWSTTLPSLKRMMVGMPRTPYLPGVAGLSSTLTLPTAIWPSYSSAMASMTGAMALHGAHQVAQKSTRTGLPDLMTSASKLPSVIVRTFSLAILYLSLNWWDGAVIK